MIKRKIVIDFEVYSDVDLTTAGAYKYSGSKTTLVRCLSYKIDKEPTLLWIPSLPFPKALLSITPEDTIYAFNATFEALIWEYVLRRDISKVPKIALTQWVDVQALCARFRFPHTLAAAAKAVGCDSAKLATGKRLIRVCCTPGYEPTKQDFQDLYAYCIIDTDATYEILTRLPAARLTDFEQRVWEQTFEMNLTGVPIDNVSVEAIIRYLKFYMEAMIEVLPEITDGFIQTAGQVKKIREFCAFHGVVLLDLQADTVDKALKRTDLPEEVETVLEIRQLIGMTAVKKYITIANYYNKGVVQGNLFYHGAGTGRWSGRAFQYHNLPRNSVPDPEVQIQRFIDKADIAKPVELAKALIRPMIKAPKGYQLIVSDYSSIENRFLAWICGDTYTLSLFEKDVCQYSDMAAYLYNIPIDQIGKNSDERQMGKVIILGCGFMMGKARFKAVAEDWGIYLTDAQATAVIKAYRAKYHLVVKSWYAISKTAKYAIQFPGKSYTTRMCTFSVVKDKVGRSWLRILLPSGRALMYMNPVLADDKYGVVPKYTGFSTKTYQMTSTALTPGLITENIVQAGARDVLAIGQLNIKDSMPEVKLSISVHDEAGGLIKVTDIKEDTLERFNRKLCVGAPWSKGLPLQAEGYIGPRYKKG